MQQKQIDVRKLDIATIQYLHETVYELLLAIGQFDECEIGFDELNNIAIETRSYLDSQGI